ncbi:carbon storage regulator CsrA [Clostridium neonatale]|uniref:carbon storage regulator CsrA n=1 Tax=Clostridium neonatale TaxID=137838 RepID=UPI00291BE307|nr:Carbon storage regulator homolog [Clostridium neonatale]
MLIITRKKGESLMIGDDIEITISKIEDGSVKIGIQAPKEVSILRKELLEEIKNENKNAVNMNSELLKNIKRNKE